MSTVIVATSLDRDDLASSSQAKHERHIPMMSFHNLRTLAGIPIGAGWQISSEKLYRSDSIAYPQTEDIDRLKKLRLAVVTDFRSVAELDKDPYQHSVNFEHVRRPIPVMGDNGRDDLLGVLRQVESEAEMISWLCDRYRLMVSEFSDIYGDWLRSLLDDDQYPQLFHCTAGKDRTGVAAALLLKLLGASESVVMEDFMLSNTLAAEQVERKMAGERVFQWLTEDIDKTFLRPLLGVRKEYLESTFTYIETEYGGFNQYVCDGLRLDQPDLQQLRSVLLEKA